MRKLIISVVSLSLLLESSTLVSHANASDFVPINIEINNSKVIPSSKVVANNTTYMPIYYVMKALTTLGLKSTWNGQNHTWSFTAQKLTHTLNLNAKSGNTTFIVNNQTVETNVPTIVAKDPKSGVMTTFIPIWYIQQVLNNVGILTDTWNGANGTWTLGTSASTANTGLTQSSALQQFLQTLNTSVQVDPSPNGYANGYRNTSLPAIGLKYAFPPYVQPNQYASKMGINVTNPNASLTANTFSQWLFDFEVKTRDIMMNNEPYAGSATQAYQLAQLFDIFSGANVTSPSTVLTQSQFNTILQNVVNVHQGYKLIAPNEVQLLTPINSVVLLGKKYIDATTYEEMIQLQDASTLTFNADGTITYNTTVKNNGINLGLTGYWMKNGICTAWQSWYRDNNGMNMPIPYVFNKNGSSAHQANHSYASALPNGFTLNENPYSLLTMKNQYVPSFGYETYSFVYENGKITTVSIYQGSYIHQIGNHI